MVKFFMRIFLLALILIFSLQSWTKADDISELEIEGVSIGDSALDFFSRKQISKYVYDFKSDEFKSSDIHSSNFKTYDAIQINYKPNDKNYTIYGISGMIVYENNIAECYKKQKKIIMDMKRDVKFMRIRDDGTYAHPDDNTGNSKVTSTYLFFENGDYVQIKCYNWSEESGYTDHLRIGLMTKELGDFYTYKAY